MKTMKLNKTNVYQLFLTGLMALMMTACAEEGVIENQVDASDVVSGEVDMDAVYEDVDEMAAISLEAADQNIGGKISEDIDDDRFCENVFSFEGTREAGTITLDFGDGCIDAKGNVRKGKIIITFVGMHFEPGSIFIHTFENYSINGVGLEGTRTVENISNVDDNVLTYSVALVGGKITWEDGTFATREVDHIRVWDRSQGKVFVSGTAHGTTRRGVAYTSEITEDLVFDKNCRRSRRGRKPVAGINVITTESKVITIYYGDGTCDLKVRISVNGTDEDLDLD